MPRPAPQRAWGHLASAVSALVDGQLSDADAERAWVHVSRCEDCRAEVDRERWVKRRLGRLSADQPSPELLGSLAALSHRPLWESPVDLPIAPARRAGLAAAGVGTLTAALAGVAGVAAVGALGFSGPGPAASIGGSTPTPGASTVSVVNTTHGVPARPAADALFPARGPAHRR